ncbi:2-succinyl-6-hydroxy-2,4-cyclohexadiene-1-carboxylate synthase [Vagococcus sp. BWB3-3]|uniref:Putative 2-succinyl-6-hydroxy-2,4-cyclohexadiene-1-carboxylate synthase n=1 Tax=Vagococcus allomyrinae TaxID=2794353 RepID=A0A940P8Y6_9ENTE|nr:2-succinyl-6-hydroxy-2,4-cyclohexadiene-1-carboxylate synthase [Vagococcus allomyrinae]MBP1039708.1 2-succinyl-6-hydroxy-2,4-cyclohexadiene-1-carboxylate synthase [Vagococcus allomyrinae]
MKLKINGIAYFYTWLTEYQATRPTLLCLHGFTGTGATFNGIANEFPDHNLLTIDLIGHGQSASFVHPYRYQMTSLTQDIRLLTNQLGITQFALLGYSMGARVALSFSLSYPELVTALILESGSPGLASPSARRERRVSDLHLAQKLLKEPLCDFINFWEALPLFESQKRLSSHGQSLIRQERLNQTAFGLATSLWAMGTGSQPDYWPQLTDLQSFPVLLVTGKEDLKFQEIAQQMIARQPTITGEIIPYAGHAVHLEQPKRFAQVINHWLKGATLDETN